MFNDILKNITTELDSLGELDLLEPEVAIGEGDTVCGTASMEARKVYTLAIMYHKKAESSDDEKMKLQLELKSEVLINTFWFMIADTLNSAVLENHHFGIKKGWNIVIFNKKCPTAELFLIVKNKGKPFGQVPKKFIDDVCKN